MSKIVFVCVREAESLPIVQKRVESVIRKLVPDNIPDAPCKFFNNGNIAYGISAYTGSIEEKNGSVCMGLIFSEKENWWQPKSGHPDGSFALFRSDEKYAEAVTDNVGSRTIWYYKDDKVFIAGTSQRAVISVAGKFELNKQVIPWILSSGTPGPSLSWCKNLRMVPPESRLLLDREKWELTMCSVIPEFNIADLDTDEHEKNLKNALVETFENFKVDLSKWILPISGGYDSRGIACFLKKTGNDLSKLNTVTWGLKASMKDKKNDAYIGKAVAESLGMHHEYFETDEMIESCENIFKRFILCSEGRIDHIPGYTDGFKTWKKISEKGKHGTIRGDESFGWDRILSEHKGRMSNGLTLCSDFSNLEHFEKYGYGKQEIPHYLSKKEDETMNMWADRVYEEFTLPVIMASLNDIKLSYVEIVNPLLSKKILMQVRTMPDQLRSDKKAFKKIVKEISPDVSFATKDATNLPERFLTTRPAIKLLIQELSADYMKDLFPDEFLKKITSNLQKTAVNSKEGLVAKAKKSVLKYLHPSIKEKLRSKITKPALDTSIIAFRIYTAGKMYQTFLEDVKPETSKISYPQHQL